MKVIFLDIDGVLNSVNSMVAFRSASAQNLDSVSVKLLQRLCEVTDAKIVISSTWRMGRDEKYFIDLFKWYGWKNAPVIGRTPVEYDKCRGEEIQMWLVDVKTKVEKYLIIDDDSDMLEEQDPYFLHVPGVHGFDISHYVRALRHFGQPDERLEDQVNFVRQSNKGEKTGKR